MKLKDIAIPGIIFMMVLMGTFSAQYEWGRKYADYGVDLEVAQESKISAAMDEMDEIGKDMEIKMLNLKQKASVLDFTAIADLAGLFIDVGSYLLKIPNVMGATIEATISSLFIEVPSWLYTGIMVLLMFSIIIPVIAIFLKRENL